MKTHEIHEILKSKKKRERGAQGGQSPHSLLLLDLRISWISWVFISGFHQDFKGFHGFHCLLCKYPQNVANALFAESIQSLGPSQCRKHAVCQKYPKPRPFNLLIKKCRPNWFSTPSPLPPPPLFKVGGRRLRVGSRTAISTCTGYHRIPGCAK